MPEGKRYFVNNGQKQAVPESQANDYLKDYPDAQEMGLFNLGDGKKSAIPISALPDFYNDYPDAQPFSQDDAPYYVNLLGKQAAGTYGQLMDYGKQGAQISTEQAKQPIVKKDPKALDVMMPGGIGYNMDVNYAGQEPGDVVQGIKGGAKQMTGSILKGADYALNAAAGYGNPTYAMVDKATREAFAEMSVNPDTPQEDRQIFNSLASKPTTVLGDWANTLNKSGAEDIQQAPHPKVAESFAMLPQIIPIAAAMTIPGAQGAVLPMFGLMGAGGGLQQYEGYLENRIAKGLIDQSYDPDIAFGIAILSAGIEAGSEQLGSVARFIKGNNYVKAMQGLATKELLETSGGKALKEITAKFIEKNPYAIGIYRKWLLNPAEEAFEEVAAQIGSYSMSASLYDKDANWKELGEQTWQAALGGFVMGGLLTSYGNALTTMRINQAREANKSLYYGVSSDGQIFEILGRDGQNLSVLNPDGTNASIPETAFEKIVSFSPNEASVLKESVALGTAEAQKAIEAGSPITELQNKISPVINENGTHLISNLHADGKPYFIKSGVAINEDGTVNLDNIDPSRPPIILDQYGKLATRIGKDGKPEPIPFADFDPSTWETHEQLPEVAQQPSTTYPLDKDGNPDIDSMDEVQLFNFNKETFGEETAISDLQGDIKLLEDKITKAEKKLATADTKSKIKARIEIAGLRGQKTMLEGLLPQVDNTVTPTPSQAVTENVETPTVSTPSDASQGVTEPSQTIDTAPVSTPVDEVNTPVDSQSQIATTSDPISQTPSDELQNEIPQVTPEQVQSEPISQNDTQEGINNIPVEQPNAIPELPQQEESAVTGTPATVAPSDNEKVTVSGEEEPQQMTTQDDVSSPAIPTIEELRAEFDRISELPESPENEALLDDLRVKIYEAAKNTPEPIVEPTISETVETPVTPSQEKAETEPQRPIFAGEAVKDLNKPDAPIQDYGEKIEGARKDQIKKYFDKINLDGKTLSTIFPKPDIKGLLESGLSVKDVSGIKVAHEFATHDKKKGERVIKFYAAYAKNILAESINLQFANSGYVFSEYGKSQIELRTKAYQDVHDKLGAEYLSLDLTKVDIREADKSGRTTYFDKGEPVTDVKFIVRFYVSKTSYFQNVEDAVNEFTEQVKANTKTDQVVYKHKLNVYSARNQRGVFYIGFPSKGDVIKLKEGITSTKEAFDLLKNPEIHADLQTMLERILTENRQSSKPAVRLKYTNETARERVGKDWRNGVNVGAKELAETFGFRGIEFGNWVNQKERQVFVNNTFDSFMDLAQLLNISPKAISLGGNIGITFGSRGSGKAAAHYEPGRKIINLTKTQGLGSLAHEWWHAIDNYFAGFETSLQGTRFASASNYLPETREEVKKSFDEVNKAVDNYTFKQRAKNLDNSRNANYFSLPHEMSARAFENFILNRLAESGQVNDFIVNYTSNEDWKGEASKYPYPIAEESVKIAESFGNLFDAIEEVKDGDKVILKHSFAGDVVKQLTAKPKQSENSLTGLTQTQRHESVKSEVAKTMSELNNTTPLQVFASPKEAYAWYEDNGASESYLEQVNTALGDIYMDGFFDPVFGQIVILSPNVPTFEAIRTTTIHEATHGTNKTFLDKIRKPALQYFSEIVGEDKIGRLLNSGYDLMSEIDRADEYIAYTVEDLLRNGIIPTEEPLSLDQINDAVKGKEKIANFEERFISTIYHETNRGNDSPTPDKPGRTSYINPQNTGTTGTNETVAGTGQNDVGGIQGNSENPKPRFAGELLGEGSIGLLKSISLGKNKDMYQRELMMKQDFDIRELLSKYNIEIEGNISSSYTDYGISHYFNVKDGISGGTIKVRISDHEATNSYRKETEYMLNGISDKNFKSLEFLTNPERFELKEVDRKPNIGDIVRNGKVFEKTRKDLPSTIQINGTPRPTTNSEGQPIADTEEKIRNFYNWFSDSKVIDSEGRPLVVYHGTAYDGFFEFRGTDRGIYFSSFDRASWFVPGNDAPQTIKIVPEFKNWEEVKEYSVKTGNDFSIANREEYDNGYFIGEDFVDDLDDARQIIQDRISGGGAIYPVYLNISNPKVIDAKGKRASNVDDSRSNKKQDGVIVNNVLDPVYDDSSWFEDTNYVVFSPTQIKSATGNSGDFSPNDPNILKHSDPPIIPPAVNPPTTQFAGSLLSNKNNLPGKRIIGKKDYGDRFADWIAENVHSVDLWQQEMKKDGFKAIKLFDVYSLLRRRKGLIKGMVDKFDEGVFTDLQKTVARMIDKNKISSKEIQLYLKAKSSLWRNDKEDIMAISPDNADSWNRANIEKIIQDFEGKIQPEEIEQLWKDVKASTDFTINTLYLDSVINKEDYDKFANRKFYIPLRGWEFDEQNTNPEDFYDYVNNEKNGINSQTYVKATIKAKGRTSEPGDPFPYIRQLAHSAVMSSVKNRIARTSLQLYRVNQNDPKITQYMYIKAPFKGNSHEAKRTRKTAEKHEIIGYDNGDRFVLVLGDPHVAQSIKGENVVLRETAKWLGESAYGKLTQFMKANFTGKNPNFFLNNFLFIDVPYAAITEGIRKEGEAGQFVKQMLTGKPFKTLHRDITNNLNSLSKGETLTAGLNSKESIESAIEQYGENRVYDTLYEMWKDAGGPTGWMQLESFEKSAKKIEQEINRIRAKEATFGTGIGKLSNKDKFTYNYPLRKGAELMDYIMKMSEQSSRFAVFVSRKMAGQNTADAALASKEATVDFDRTGQASTVFNQLFAFFKPTVSATYGIYKMGKYNKEKFGYALGSFFALGVLQAILAYMSFPDNDKDKSTYDGVPDYDKLNNLVFPRFWDEKSFAEGKYIKIPLPQFFRAIYALGVTSTQAAMGKIGAGELVATNLKNLTGALTPFNVSGDDLGRTIVPTAVTPAYDIAVNETFSGRPVYKEMFTKDLEDKTPESQKGLKSTFPPLVEAAQWWNEVGGGNDYTKAGSGLDPVTGVPQENKTKELVFDINPAKLQHVFETVGGGRVKFFRQVFSTGMAIASPEKDLNDWDIPLFYRYLGRTKDSDPKQAFWDAQRAVKEYKYYINNQKKEDPAEAIKLLTQYGFMNDLVSLTKFTKKNMDRLEEQVENATDSKIVKAKTDTINMVVEKFKSDLINLEKKYKITLDK